MRRRKPSVVWIPQTNNATLGMGGTNAYHTFSVDVAGAAGDFTVGEIPIVIDDTRDPTAPGDSLSDIENSGYRLRRIVGKIWAVALQAAADTAGMFIVTAGIIVRRTDIFTGTSTAFAADPTGQLVAPGEIENNADPWIWRRSWLLGNNLATAPGNFAANSLPEDNISGHSGVDGPHIDQKTARIVGPEERLFLDVSSTVVTPGGGVVPAPVQIITDLRVLGSMRTSVGNRRNASR